MRWSKAFIPTQKEKPKDTDIISHELMLRAGMMKQVSAGVYSLLPLGLKVMRKIEGIIREEMNNINSHEISMTALQPKELWDQTGRWELYGDDMFKLKDKKGSEYGLAPTHEEPVTDIALSHCQSYKDLPLNVFQIQTKFRDETRPRFGLLRGKEFLMKDAYSFDTSKKGLDKSFNNMNQAYTNIFSRLRLNFMAVEADSGAIGGTGSVEFMALSDKGEDTLVHCNNCDYAANMEKAVSALDDLVISNEKPKELETISTPNVGTIDDVAEFLNTKKTKFIKSLVYIADNEPILVLTRGDYNVNETKLKNEIGYTTLEMADAKTVEKVIGAPAGFVGPIGLDGQIKIYMDSSVENMVNGITGANKVDEHIIGVTPKRDFVATKTFDFREVNEGDSCMNCKEGELKYTKGIEIGHIFKLGTVYSEKMNATFVDSDGISKPYVMGCYGIGVSRLLPTLIQQKHDDNGIIWPLEVAPYHAVIVPSDINNPLIMGEAENLYEELKAKGVDVIFDDRDARLGYKFKDIDLIGIPIRITVGKDFLKDGRLEYKLRTSNRTNLKTRDDLIEIMYDTINLLKPRLR